LNGANILKNPRVLIADDVLEIRELLSVFLECSDCEIIGEVVDGNAALKSINELDPDMVFLDINMPGISGLDILDIIKENQTIFPVIISGDNDINTIKTAMAKGAKGFISKPFSENKVEQLVSKYINDQNNCGN